MMRKYYKQARMRNYYKQARMRKYYKQARIVVFHLGRAEDCSTAKCSI
jgi:hypothetical protein